MALHMASNHNRAFNYFLLANIICSLIILCSAGDDLYQLLGISRDADDRQIRRAFKKLAIQMHPDKNQDDPSAHDNFVKINRAYEILKDEELRKKYDLYGEDGLKDNAQQQQHQYQSWQFYKEQFGIYDDDQEISTLNSADFENLVLNGKRRWFVNFYSAHCSHCHELAPAWRKFARHVEGVIGVGAVNCLDEYMLCQQQRIGHYPMLIMYPEGERYDGQRSVDDLIDFILIKLDSKIIKLTEENFDIKLKEHLGKPWLLDLCNDESTSSSMECLSFRNRKLVAAAFDGSLNVGVISCNIHEDLCEKLGGSTGLYYYPPDQLGQSAGDRIQSLDAKEIVSLILKNMPEIQDLDEEKMNAMITTGTFDDQTDPWLVHFTKDGSGHLEYRLLPSVLSVTKIKVGQFNCTKHPTVCQILNLNKFPTFIIFKPKVGYEIHYGKPGIHDVASFAQDCAFTNVRTLSAADFSTIISNSDSTAPWFIDFFAPWCPPCMRLLPEFRKAARLINDGQGPINFGTVDCTVNNQACLSANVHSYPTTVLFNGTKSDSFIGLHNMQELVDFVEDIKNPPVIALTPETLEERVLNRQGEEIWLVDFYSPHCAPCQQLAPEIRKLAKMFREYTSIFIADLDCSKYNRQCQQQYIQAYPTIRIFPRNRGTPMDYNSWFRDVMSMRTWLFAFLPSKVSDLIGDDFYDILNNEQPWLIDFFAPWCGHCQVFAPEFEKVAEALEGRVNVGKINCDLHMHVCQAALIRAYPSVRFYSGADPKSSDSQSAYGLEINSQNAQQITTMVENLLKQSRIETVTTKRDEL